MQKKIEEIRKVLNDAEWYIKAKEHGTLKRKYFGDHDKSLLKVAELHKVLQQANSADSTSLSVCPTCGAVEDVEEKGPWPE